MERSERIEMTVKQRPPTTVAPVEKTGDADNGIELVSVETLPVVRFTKTTVLRKQPDVTADDVGTIRSGARAAVLAEAPAGAGCKTRWLQLVPRGWTCDTTTEPTELAPTIPKAFSFADEDPTPPVTGTYGIVRGAAIAYDSKAAIAAGEGHPLSGKNSVRAAGSMTVNGKRYWRTSGGDLIDASSIVGMSPSRFRGVIVEDPATLPAWVRGTKQDPVTTRALPQPRSKLTGKLAPRTIVAILETSVDGKFVRVGDDQWIKRTDVRVATLAAPPPETAEDERWFDVDLDEQVLVAYEGKRPVYATLVSTGKWGHATPTLITRIASKLERTTMTSDKTDVYSVADVPWTMFYDGNYALHTSYWHDGFGSVRSHGCINLAPHDARLLYRWSSPDVPPGWIAVKGDVENPGSLVRVRSSKLPEPRFRGYARRLREQAQDGGDIAMATP